MITGPLEPIHGCLICGGWVISWALKWYFNRVCGDPPQYISRSLTCSHHIFDIVHKQSSIYKFICYLKQSFRKIVLLVGSLIIWAGWGYWPLSLYHHVISPSSILILWFTQSCPLKTSWLSLEKLSFPIFDTHSFHHLFGWSSSLTSKYR